MKQPSPRPNSGDPLAVWERAGLAVFACLASASMLWVTGVWMFMAGMGLDPACGQGRTLSLGLLMLLTAPIVGLGWSAASSMALTAIRRRGLHGRAWLIAPALAAMLALYWGITAEPARPAKPGECPRFEMSHSEPPLVSATYARLHG